ncbi:MAG TPA: hypothetical protein VGA51_11490 [Casimicrobiaceae bacterium]
MASSRNQPESGHRKVVIEGEGDANARSFHDRKARCIDGREPVEIVAPEIFPRNFEIAQLAGKDLHRSGLIDRLFPRQRHIAVGVAIEKSERLDYDRDRRVKFGARSLQDVPLFPGLRVKRITRKSKGNPRSAVDERGFAVPHQGSS